MNSRHEARAATKHITRDGRRVGLVLVAATFIAVSLGAIAQPPPPVPGLPPVPYPAENQHSEAKRILGKVLFWDEQLSSDNTMSCGTCHRPAFAGADPRLGVHPGSDENFGTPDDILGSPGVVRRDARGNLIADSVFGFEPQVTGRSAQSYFAAMFAQDSFWDGRGDSTFVDPETSAVAIQNGGGLESQAIGPILSRAEMAHDGRTWAEVRVKLQTITPMLMASNIPGDVQTALDAAPTYAQLFTNAFGDGAITARRIAFAIATYERTLLANQTPWDRFTAGDTTALTTLQRQGWEFLRDNTACLRCHRPPLFTDNNFHNIGLRPSAEDLGREAITGNPGDRGRFKTSSLRNVGLRESLMHVGWVTDVQDALDFYNAGTQNTGHTQFIQDQTPIPGQGPIQFVRQINIPVIAAGGFPAQAAIVDFLSNGLTDPRAAAELPPFDRPLLFSETQLLSEVFVNFDYSGLENGSAANPYDTVLEALVHLTDQGTLRVAAGTLPGPITIEKPVTIRAQDGAVTIGAGAAIAAGTALRVGFVAR